MITKIVSGGQTGVDRGALDAAIELGIEHGGYSPLGHMGEDGRIPDKYRLTEALKAGYPHRTELNVINSDVTIILGNGRPSLGTDLTKRLAKIHGKSMFIANIDVDDLEFMVYSVETITNFHPECTINVAGPRESKDPGIQERSKALLISILKLINA